ncbi:MAG: four-helix bundle copper-binding protein [Cytophagaceae bacterium]|nr:four-helix bundle copper-binding protein [Cytophagaceae bacterium]
METKKGNHHHSNHNHDALIQTLLDCAKACENCAQASLEEDDVTMMAHCIELDRDCADICFQGARYLLRDAEISHKYLMVCEEMCRLCAEECGKHSHDHCKKCAESCRKCAEECHKHHGEAALK